MDNSDLSFLILNENIGCDPSLESSRRDGSNEGHNTPCCFSPQAVWNYWKIYSPLRQFIGEKIHSEYMFLLKNMANYT